MHIFKNIILSIVLTFAILIPIQANGEQKIADFANNTADKIISVIKSNYSNEEKQEKLIAIFHQSVDIDWMGKFALGKYYNTLSKEQLNEYLIAYREFLTSIYVSKFTEYNGQGLYIESIKRLSASQYILNTKVGNLKSSMGQSNIAYRIKDFGNKCQIRDIIAEGLSVILGQRSDFHSIISSKGIDDLIQRLKDKGKGRNVN